MAMKISHSVPVIATADVVETVRYLEEVLGFAQQWSWGEPPVYCGLRAGEAWVYVNHDPDLAAAIGEGGLAPELFLWVEGIESAYARHRNAGAEVIEELSARPWGAMQYVLLEPNGYRIKVAETVGGPKSPDA